MAFTVETGSIVANANSYVSLSEANTYFIDRGNPTAWEDAFEADRKAALVYATTWLDQNIIWHSSLQDLTQPLGWPRVSFYDREGRLVGGTGVIPNQVKNAVCELALEWLQEGFNSASSEGVKSESIGSTSITYSKSHKSYSFVRMSLKGLGSSASNVVEVFRA